MAALARAPDVHVVLHARKYWRAYDRRRRHQFLKHDHIDEAMGDANPNSWGERWEGHYIVGSAPGVVQLEESESEDESEEEGEGENGEQVEENPNAVVNMQDAEAQ